MRWTTHILVGATTGLLIKKPVLSLPAGLAEHVVMDIIPHRDFQSRLGYVLDTLVGIGIFAELAHLQKSSGAPEFKAALWGAASNALPDVELLLNLFEEFPREKRLFPTHNGILPHGTECSDRYSYVSTIPQAVATAISIFILARHLKRGGFERA